MVEVLRAFASQHEGQLQTCQRLLKAFRPWAIVVALQKLDHVRKAEASGEWRCCVDDDAIAPTLGFILSEIAPAEQRVAQPDIVKRLEQMFVTDRSFRLSQCVEHGVTGNADEIGATAGLRKELRQQFLGLPADTHPSHGLYRQVPAGLFFQRTNR